MLAEIRSFATGGLSFAFETTLSGRGYLPLLRRMKAQGYEIHLFFLWLKSVELALSRIRERVSRGGHDIPELVVRRRFDRSMSNFLLSIAKWRMGGRFSTTPDRFPRQLPQGGVREFV